MSLADRGNFFGRTCNRAFGDASFFEGDIGLVGDLELKLTRLVFPFKLVIERVRTPNPGVALAGDAFVDILQLVSVVPFLVARNWWGDGQFREGTSLLTSSVPLVIVRGGR